MGKLHSQYPFIEGLVPAAHGAIAALLEEAIQVPARGDSFDRTSRRLGAMETHLRQMCREGNTGLLRQWAEYLSEDLEDLAFCPAAWQDTVVGNVSALVGRVLADKLWAYAPIRGTNRETLAMVLGLALAGVIRQRLQTRRESLAA